jgi:hypothetical protein
MMVAVAATGCQEVPRTYSTADGTGQVVFQDGFNRNQLGPNWLVTGEGITVENDAVKVHGARNHPAWLKTPLPDDFRIEFDAWSESEDGDIKVEVAGDGHSYATTDNYVSTGYVLIFGGWNNSLNVIARQDEHAKDRESTPNPQVEPGRRYHWVITRTGAELSWEVDGKELLRMNDPAPLTGGGHRNFAFNGWETETHFDNLVVESLSQPEEK